MPREDLLGEMRENFFPRAGEGRKIVLIAVSIKYRLRAADCGLGIKHRLRCKTRTAAISGK